MLPLWQISFHPMLWLWSPLLTWIASSPAEADGVQLCIVMPGYPSALIRFKALPLGDISWGVGTQGAPFISISFRLCAGISKALLPRQPCTNTRLRLLILYPFTFYMGCCVSLEVFCVSKTTTKAFFLLFYSFLIYQLIFPFPPFLTPPQKP